MIVKEVVLIKRKDGYFYWKDKVVRTVRPKNGFGVALHVVASQVDKDFDLPQGEGLLFLSAKQIEEIMEALDRSDEMTFEMLKHAWKGERPFKLRVEHFI